ncbi:hypothetical protein [Marinobacterium lutimaris]|uniref:Uncharacterized protein n=1 Tax=Marinobacterium lutimaris TaxID=568106 RepID=A0A1H5ZDE4_9GAMM|nr:hypothetical protein [Marinobacterium lutimaris]SEG34543.1 hypothetical protein SAMN05444390_1012131 [Marinobacterium lutimaris]
MGPTQIGILILGGILVLAVTAYIVQTIETQRREKRMRLLALRDQIRRADHLLTNLPAFYISPDIRSVLIKYMDLRWHQMIELERSPNYRQELEKLAQRASEPFEPGNYPSGSLTHSPDRNTARSTRALLRELAQFLTDLQKQNLFSKGALHAMLRHIKQSYTRLTIELEIMDAQQTEQVAGPQVALHTYRSALTRLQSFNDAYQIDVQIFALSKKLEECQNIADEQRAKEEDELRRRDAAEREREERQRYR